MNGRTATVGRGRRPADRSSRMHHRFRLRRRRVQEEQRRRRRKLAASLVLVALLAGGAVGAIRSPLFAITEVRVTGTVGDRGEQVRLATGVLPGDNLLTADLGAARERVEALTWVHGASLRRIPPSMIEVQVVAREPVAVLPVAGGAWLVDAEGVVLGGGSRAGLPVVIVGDGHSPRVGEQFDAPTVRHALAVHRQLPGPLRTLAERYEAPTPASLRLWLALDDEGEGVWVRFGTAERVDAKARAIGLLLDRARVEGLPAGELDVRAPDNPVLVPG
jgi:cell division protein FtsQ